MISDADRERMADDFYDAAQGLMHANYCKGEWCFDCGLRKAAITWNREDVQSNTYFIPFELKDDEFEILLHDAVLVADIAGLYRMANASAGRRRRARLWLQA